VIISEFCVLVVTVVFVLGVGRFLWVLYLTGRDGTPADRRRQESVAQSAREAAARAINLRIDAEEVMRQVCRGPR
jgi:hypothetical protein